jgi:superfamily II DNA or RNA helicase
VLNDQPSVRPGLFRLPDDPVASTILIPGFRAAESVRGAFGWFTAGWIARLAPGLAEYLNREHAAPICFTVAPALFAPERAAVERAVAMSADEATQLVANVFASGRAEATALGRHALNCLAWMIATERLRLRIAVPTSTSNYHPKIWLFDDGCNRVLARGSGNATVHGVAEGVEHLDVDVSWIPDSRRRVNEGIAILDDWSEGRSLGIERVVELPDALEQNIVQTAPDTPPQPEDYARAAARDARFRRRARLARTGLTRRRLRIPDTLEWCAGTYAHQGEAVAAWEGGPNPERGIVSMATGAGKTLTALICAARAQDRLDGRSFLVVVSAPSIPLIKQWGDEIEKFGIRAVAPALEPSPDGALTRLIRALPGGGTHLAVVTNNMLCSQRFQRTLTQVLGRVSGPTMLIGDEAHTLGADSFLANKPEFFERRLGLSATPERQYDPDGTEQIFDFFGGSVYEFGLDRAIGFCLVPYDYHVHASTLDGDELDEFQHLSERIGAAIRAGAVIEDRSLTGLLIRRRRVIETAVSKLELLRAVLEHRGPRHLTQALVYASAKNPEQFDRIAALLTDLNIKWAPVTEATTADRRLLERTLTTFARGGSQVLLAKKVLDQGVDIPSIREAFIVASSMVEREWIQRRGRVLRRHTDKPWAVVHDFLALPPVRAVGKDATSTVGKIVQTELHRAYSFAAHARNAAGEHGVLSDLERIQKSYWPMGVPDSRLLCASGEYHIASSTPRGRLW